MYSKLVLALCVVLCIVSSLEAASLRGAEQKSQSVVHKLDYETVEANVRSARQAYPQDSGEDSDEDDEEDDAELQHQNAIRRQQAYEQSVGDSQEGSDEDDDDTADDDDDADFYGRRLRRDVSEAESHNEVQETPKPSETTEDKEKPQPATEGQSSPATASNPSASGSSNTSVLILIRDAIKKVTELPNTQQVATSAQQYFQLFEHFLQQTIEQVIGDDDDDEETESTTILPDSEKETESETSDKVTETNDKPQKNESADKQTASGEPEKAHAESKPEETNEIKA